MKHLLWLLPLLATPGHCLLDSIYLDSSRLGTHEYERLWMNKQPLVSRVGTTLNITVGTQTVSFTDDTTNGESARRHSLVRTYNISATRTDFLILNGYYEGYDYTLVNGETGAQVRTAGEPMPSLSQLFYLYTSCNLDEESAYESSELVLIDPADFSRAFEQKFEHSTFACPLSAKWISDEEIVVLKKSFVRTPIPDKQELAVSTVLDSYALRKRNGKWVQEPLRVSN